MNTKTRGRAFRRYVAALALAAAACSAPADTALLQVISFDYDGMQVGALATTLNGSTDSVSVNLKNVTAGATGKTDILIDRVRAEYTAPNGAALPSREWRMTITVPAGSEATLDDVPVAAADLKAQLAGMGFTPVFTVQTAITVSGQTIEGHDVEAVGYLPIRFE
jgi:hypothetical protein